jgi:hypothetical protein
VDCAAAAFAAAASFLAAARAAAALRAALVDAACAAETVVPEPGVAAVWLPERAGS